MTGVALTACSGSGTTTAPASSASSSPASSADPAASSPGSTSAVSSSPVPVGTSRAPVPGGAGSTRSTGPSAPTGSAAPTSPAAPSLPSGDVGSTPGRPTPGTPTTSSGCGTGQLSLNQVGGQGAAGSVIRTYALRKTGPGTCVLYGFPGASLVDAQGRQVGAAARRQGSAGGAVQLATGQAAVFDVALAYAGCPGGAPRSDSLRVYPPGERGSLLTPFQLPVCTTPTVTAVRASR